MKFFFDGSALVPRPWLDAAGVPSHRSQADLVVAAKTKRAALDALTERGVSQGAAEHLVRNLRLMGRVYFTPLNLLVEAEVIDPEAVGVYVWSRGVKGDPIVRVEPTGDTTVIATLDSDGPRGLHVIPATPDATVKFQAYLTLSGKTHVHRAGCADLAPGRLRNSQHDRPYDLDATFDPATGDPDAARAAISEEINSDFIDEGMSPADMLDTVHFAPCTGLSWGS